MNKPKNKTTTTNAFGGALNAFSSLWSAGKEVLTLARGALTSATSFISEGLTEYGRMMAPEPQYVTAAIPTQVLADTNPEHLPVIGTKFNTTGLKITPNYDNTIKEHMVEAVKALVTKDETNRAEYNDDRFNSDLSAAANINDPYTHSNLFAAQELSSVKIQPQAVCNAIQKISSKLVEVNGTLNSLNQTRKLMQKKFKTRIPIHSPHVTDDDDDIKSVHLESEQSDSKNDNERDKNNKPEMSWAEVNRRIPIVQAEFTDLVGDYLLLWRMYNYLTARRNIPKVRMVKIHSEDNWYTKLVRCIYSFFQVKQVEVCVSENGIIRDNYWNYYELKPKTMSNSSFVNMDDDAFDDDPSSDSVGFFSEQMAYTYDTFSINNYDYLRYVRYLATCGGLVGTWEQNSTKLVAEGYTFHDKQTWLTLVAIVAKQTNTCFHF